MNLNCILLGDCNVGKSHLLSHFKYHTSDLCVYVPTIGVDFHVYKKILRIWDTSGNKRFSSVLRPFIHSSDLCIICYNNEASLKNIPAHIKTVLEQAKPGVPILIVCFCKDISSGKELADAYGCHFLQCNVYSKEDCAVFFDTVIDHFCKKSKPSEKRVYCWYNLW